MVSKREVVPQDERSSESCLHCDLVEEHIEGQEMVDIGELAAHGRESCRSGSSCTRGTAGAIARRDHDVRGTRVPGEDRDDCRGIEYGAMKAGYDCYRFQSRLGTMATH